MHAKRSQLSITPGLLAEKASLGKVKVRGDRRPFTWHVSSLGLTGDLQQLFRDLVVLQRQQKVSGLPDLTSENLSCLTPGRESMSMGRFHYLSRLVFQEMGWKEEVASVLTSYSARRVMPSAADGLGLSAADRIALGGWAGSSSASSLGACAKRLYSGVQVDSGTVVREYIIRIVQRTIASPKTLAPWAALPATFPELLGARVRNSEDRLISQQKNHSLSQKMCHGFTVSNRR